MLVPVSYNTGLSGTSLCSLTPTSAGLESLYPLKYLDFGGSQI